MVSTAYDFKIIIKIIEFTKQALDAIFLHISSDSKPDTLKLTETEILS